MNPQGCELNQRATKYDSPCTDFTFHFHTVVHPKVCDSFG